MQQGGGGCAVWGCRLIPTHQKAVSMPKCRAMAGLSQSLPTLQHTTSIKTTHTTNSTHVMRDPGQGARPWEATTRAVDKGSAHLPKRETDSTKPSAKARALPWGRSGG
jgi:hypothetical protein